MAEVFPARWRVLPPIHGERRYEGSRKQEEERDGDDSCSKEACEEGRDILLGQVEQEHLE